MAFLQAEWWLSCRQNAELAKLRQELSKVSKELLEKSEASRQEEQQRKALEAKAATFEKQVLQLQVSRGALCTCHPACLHGMERLMVTRPHFVILWQ